MPATAARRLLTAVDTPPGPAGVTAVLAALPGALDGSGPAIAPLPLPAAGPAGAHARAQRDAVRPDDPGSPLERDGVAVVVTTSGSTGAPRGVLLPGGSLLAAAVATHEVLGGPGRWIVAMPVTGVGGLMVLVRSVAGDVAPLVWPGVGGAAPFTAASFAPVAREALTRRDADGAPVYVSLVPTQLARLVDEAGEALDALAAFDHVLVGAAALPADLRAAATAAGVRLTSTYGASETCGGVVYDGTPLPGVTVRLDPVDATASPGAATTGRILIGGATLAAGYRLDPGLTAATFVDGSLRTEDIGRLDVDGRLEVTGRLDDVVKVGGAKVSLPAVADALRTFVGVADAVAVPVPDPQWGSAVHAFVVLAGERAGGPGTGAAVADRLRSHVIAVLGREAAPHAVHLVAALPLLPTGKVDRQALLARAASG